MVKTTTVVDAGAASSLPADMPANACDGTEVRCNPSTAGVLETCEAGQWVPQNCAAGEQCIDAADGPKCVLPVEACAGRDGQSICTDTGEMLACTDGGGAMTVATCSDSTLCKAGLAAGACANCSPGTFQCTGIQLQSCDPEGQAFGVQEQCASAALCDVKAGRCKAPACEVGEFKCSGDALNRCNQDQTAFEMSKRCGPGLCDAQLEDCRQCDPGSKSCEGNTIRTCDTLGKGFQSGPTCEGETPVCDAQRGCVECKAKADCKTVHDCADLTGCNAGVCRYTAKPRQTAGGDGSLVREGVKTDNDPIFVVFGNALFYVSGPDEIDLYGGFDKVTVGPLSRYSQCPVSGTLVRERDDAVGYIYASDERQLNWVKSPDDLEKYCGGSARVQTVPRNSLTNPVFRPPLGLCNLNRR